MSRGKACPKTCCIIIQRPEPEVPIPNQQLIFHMAAGVSNNFSLGIPHASPRPQNRQLHRNIPAIVMGTGVVMPYNSTPLCMGRYSSPAKFEVEFQKTYGAQKLWKVPEPKRRRRLRVAVIEKVIPSFTNTWSTTISAPQESLHRI
ncbi:hypothetical protein HU200_049207 [Digitaria exilis]|uniref:Exocyst complex subunit Exo70 C-terminal domain-containing protein n=1 Tax=Digitaria exilis TaxID=1010633 RepID=A0A835B506_9POAL|nr:hypothetical protein HU200_049207 [Digitaria exilis]